MNTTVTLKSPVSATLYYDGDCPFCRACARFIEKHGSQNRITLQSLQGSDKENASGCYESIIFVSGSKQSHFSGAVIDVLKTLGKGWWLLGVFLWLIPRPLRDTLYRFVGKRRAWFAKFI